MMRQHQGGMMSDLEKELLQLFEIRKVRLDTEKVLNMKFIEAQKDIKLLILRFSEGIPNVEISLNDEESLIWDSSVKTLMYANGDNVQHLDAVEKQTIIKVRPHLSKLVKRAQEICLEA